MLIGIQQSGLKLKKYTLHQYKIAFIRIAVETHNMKNNMPGLTAAISIYQNPDNFYNVRWITKVANSIQPASCIGECMSDCLQDRHVSASVCIRGCRAECQCFFC